MPPLALRRLSRILVPGALLFLVACWLDKSRVSIAYYDVPTLPRAMLAVTISDGDLSWPVKSIDIGAMGREGRSFATRKSGTLRVGFNFTDGATVASVGEVTVPLQRDWGYGFTIQVDSLDPTRTCFGCLGKQSFPLAPQYRRSARDSVWLVWGGNSFKNPVVY